MRILTCLLFLFIQSAAYSQCMKRCELRQTFHQCEDKTQTEILYSKLTQLSNPDAINQGYKGAVTASRARFSSNPIKKYSFCKTGLEDLDLAIQKTPHDIELRYLRMIIQTNVPSFLGLSSNVTEDKTIILSQLNSEKDEHLRKLIREFLIKSGVCTDGEKKLLASL